MAGEFFVSGSEPAVLSTDDPLAFFPTTVAGTWAYVNRKPRIAKDGDRYRLALVRNRKQERDENDVLRLVTKGGTLALQLDTTAIIGSVEDEQRWTEAIKRSSPFVPPEVDRLTFRSLALRGGTMSIAGLESLVADPGQYQNIDVGSSTSLPVSLALTGDGADTLWRVLEKGGSFPVSVVVRGKFDQLIPGAHYRIVADARKAREYFGLDVEAAASYFGLADVKVDVGVVRDRLMASGAVVIEWIAKPENVDESRVAELEKSIVDTWARWALEQMVKDVIPQPEAADPEGFFGGVSVALKDIEEVATLNLSAEFKENDLRTQTFTATVSLTELTGLDVDTYGVDVTGDNMLPVTINLGPDPGHIRRYLCQFGYRRPDGTFSADSAEATGQDGLLLRGVVQWSPDDPAPEQTEIQFSGDFEPLDWQDVVQRLRRDNGESGVLFDFTPGTYIKTIALLTDLPRAAVGSFASVEWNTELPPNPQGTEPAQPKNYSGGVVYEGAGPAAAPEKLTIEFPYNPETVAAGWLTWRAVMVAADGTVTRADGRHRLDQVSTVLAVRGVLRPADDAADDDAPDGAVPGDGRVALVRALRRTASRAGSVDVRRIPEPV